eukprot:5292778-Ditylum_brightwellii.AAC.1
MAMFLYAQGVLPIILQLKDHQQYVESLNRVVEKLQVWYADDTAKAAFFAAIRKWFQELCRIGPPLGYFPEPDKSIPVTALQNIDLAKNYFKTEKFKIKTGYRYLGGHIREGKEDFVTEK